MAKCRPPPCPGPATRSNPRTQARQWVGIVLACFRDTERPANSAAPGAVDRGDLIMDWTLLLPAAVVVAALAILLIVTARR